MRPRSCGHSGNILGAYAPAQKSSQFRIAASEPSYWLLTSQGGVGGGLTGFISNLRQFIWIPVSQDTFRRVSLRVFGHVMNLDLNFHLKRKTGALNCGESAAMRAVRLLHSSCCSMTPSAASACPGHQSPPQAQGRCVKPGTSNSLTAPVSTVVANTAQRLRHLQACMLLLAMARVCTPACEGCLAHSTMPDAHKINEAESRSRSHIEEACVSCTPLDAMMRRRGDQGGRPWHERHPERAVHDRVPDRAADPGHARIGDVPGVRAGARHRTDRAHHHWCALV